MANCTQCGKELPSFTFGDQQEVCADCRRQQEVAQPEIGAKGMAQPAMGRRPSMLDMARMFPVTAAIVVVNLAIYLGGAIYSLKTGLGSP
ncbi:MAG TPA: hypothetical protein VFP40_00805, partial [Terriglobales bacterium]|nr:hypothetical protein [Terriglobales bacterium]